MPSASANRHAPDEIDRYLAGLPSPEREALEDIRQSVRSLAPTCTERVSYGIPIFRLGRDLIGLSASPPRCSLHVMSPALAQSMAAELKGVQVSGATIHFTAGAPLSRALLETIIQARIRENGQR